MHERNSDPLALVASHQMTQFPYQSHQHSYKNSQHQQQVSPYQSSQYGAPLESQQYSVNQSSTPLSITYPSKNYQSYVHYNVYSPSSSIPQLEYAPPKGDDPIDAINHMMSFLTAVVTSCYPTTNNQLRNLSNPRQQAIINEGRVTLQPIQGRHTSFVAGTTRTYTPRASGSNSGKQMTVIKESLIQTVTLLKNNFKKEESRNIDREIALEKKIKQLDNIFFKRDQSAQTVHMLTKPQFFYDHTTKQALGFQNPFYLKKSQQLEPKLYDGNVIKNTSSIVIPDSEETPMLAEEREGRDPSKVEVPKELPKVSMVNTSLKKLKHHLAGFDMVVKERTTATAITEGSWGFEHTKACFRDEIIPFVKALKDLFNTFDQYLIDELSEEKVLVITALKDELRKLKRKALVDNVVTKHTINPEMLKNNVEPITLKLLNNRTTHSTYIKHTQEEAAVLRDLVEHIKANYPLDHPLESACRLLLLLLLLCHTCDDLFTAGTYILLMLSSDAGYNDTTVLSGLSTPGRNYDDRDEIKEISGRDMID
ncbi:hypothetical protein Tco_0954144 [Tanacetum coccineum]|uniref:Uncharacterized protein n=1 Tax=Tanacetum coccineum TaxID=301880 RepID=A0ABQ5E4F1_9ASTR